MTDGHSLIYPPCKKHEGDFVHLCKNEQSGFCPRGILSTGGIFTPMQPTRDDKLW